MIDGLIRRSEVEKVLTSLGGCDASDKEAAGWDKAIDAALAQIGQIKSADNTQFEVTELCPHCEREITVIWNTESDGLQIFCPNCGKSIMLCSMCDARDGKPCDWTEKGCKHSDDRYGRDRWIPCSERLAEPYESVLVTAKKEGDKTSLVYQGIRCGDSFELSGVMNSKDYTVTAWQPEPEPWKGENDV